MTPDGYKLVLAGDDHIGCTASVIIKLAVELSLAPITLNEFQRHTLKNYQTQWHWMCLHTPLYWHLLLQLSLLYCCPYYYRSNFNGHSNNGGLFGIPTNDDIKVMNDRFLEKINLPSNVDCDKTKMVYDITNACFLKYVINNHNPPYVSSTISPRGNHYWTDGAVHLRTQQHFMTGDTECLQKNQIFYLNSQCTGSCPKC